MNGRADPNFLVETNEFLRSEARAREDEASRRRREKGDFLVKVNAL